MEIILIAAVVIGFAMFRIAFGNRQQAGLTTGYVQPVERQTEYIIVAAPVEYTGEAPAWRYGGAPERIERLRETSRAEVARTWEHALVQAHANVVNREFTPKQDDDLDEMFKDLWDGPK